MDGEHTRPIQAALADTDTDTLTPGVLAGEYEILDKIAAGSNGTVYAAEHRVLRRRAAVKVLHREAAASPESVHRFTREARAVNLIKHSNIVDVYYFGELPDGRPYYVMEFLEGTTLAEILRDQGRLTPPQAVELLMPICSALAAAHAAGVVHRDVKASNIFVARPGLSWRAKLLDFGVAKLLRPQRSDPDLTSVEQRIGTPAVMAPEQIRNGDIDARTDVYAMGVLLYLVLTGEYPFRGNVIEVEHMHLMATPSPPSRLAPLSPELDEVVLRCMAKQPMRRFSSMDELAAALRNAVDTVEDTTTRVHAGVHSFDMLTPPVGPPSALDEASERTSDALSVSSTVARRPPRRRSSRLAIAAALGLAMVGGIVAFAMRGSRVTAREAVAPAPAPVVEMKAAPQDERAVKAASTPTPTDSEKPKPVNKPEETKAIAKPASKAITQTARKTEPKAAAKTATKTRSLDTKTDKPAGTAKIDAAKSEHAKDTAKTESVKDTKTEPAKPEAAKTETKAESRPSDPKAAESGRDVDSPFLPFRPKR